MSSKPPLPVKPGAPLPKPRRKAPPVKPVPYHKHKEHQKQDISTFKSHQLIQSKVPPPVAEKPPRRDSLKGEPSTEFYQPKKTDSAPIHYGIPTIPGRLVDSRPRLNTPLVPPEPDPTLISNGDVPVESQPIYVSTGVVDPTPLNNGAEVYTQAYDHVEDKSEDVEGYAVVSPSRSAKLAKQPLKSAAPPVVEKKTKLPQEIHDEPLEYAVSEAIYVSSGVVEPPLESNGRELLYTEAYEPVESRDGEEGYAIVPQTRAPAKLPKPPPVGRKPPPLVLDKPKLTAQPDPLEYAVVSPQPTRTSKPTALPRSSGSPIEPSKKFQGLDNEYSKTVHSPPANTPATTDGYSKLNRPEVPTVDIPSAEVPHKYSALNVQSAPRLVGTNPTMEASYGHLDVNQMDNHYEMVIKEQENEYEQFSEEPIAPTSEKPKAKARIASQKVKEGSVQLQATRDRSDFTGYEKDLEPMEQKPSKPIPPAKPSRPPLEPPKPSGNGGSVPTSPVSMAQLEQSGYETVNTLDTQAEEDDCGDKQVLFSPKIVIDVDHIRAFASVENDENTQAEMDNCYENNVAINAVGSHKDVETENDLPVSPPELFTVPQHAIPGPMGYCEMDVQQLPTNQPATDRETAGEIDGDNITVMNQFYPNTEGYCDLSMSSQSPPKPEAGLYSEVEEKATARQGPESAVMDSKGYCDIDIKAPSSAHAYDVVQDPPKSKPKVPLRPPIKSASVEVASAEGTSSTKKLVKMATTDEQTRKPPRRSRPRRTPPPPPIAKAADDNILPVKTASPTKVAGEIATLPRGQSLVKPTSQGESTFSTDQISSKSKALSSKNSGPASPRLGAASPGRLKRFFAKKPPTFAEPGKKWLKKISKGNKESVIDKTKSLPSTSKAKPDIPTLDCFEDDDDGVYSIIPEPMVKPQSAGPFTRETRRSSGGSKDYKTRSSLRKKKEKKSAPVRRSNSAEHLYDSPDSPRNDPRARLPIPDETHAGLYAMVTSRPVDSGQFNGSAKNSQSPEHVKANGASIELSPTRNSLYTKEGLVVTEIGGADDTTEEHIVSSADIEHTVSSAGSVYAIVQARPSKKKKHSTSDEPQSPSDVGSSQPPRKPPRSPSLSSRPRLSKGSSLDSPQEVSGSSTPDRSSGPPAFPPPPPPKSVTPEPTDDGAYEIITTSSKKKKAVVQAKKIDSVEDGQGYALVSEDHTDSGPSETKPSESLQRPPHLYTVIKQDEVEEATVSVRMVSHGYATVVDKDSNKKKARPAKPKPQPPPPFKKKTEAVSSPPHKPLVPVSSSPLLDDDGGREQVPGKRTHSFSKNTGNAQNGDGQPKFLFSRKLCQSLIAVGDGQSGVSPYPSTMMATVDDDSDAEILYSTDWDSSTDGEPEETVNRPKTFFIAREILTTERTFVKGLTLLDKDFRQAVRSANNAHDKPVIADDALKLILGNVSSLLSLNSDMLKDLETRMENWENDPRIGDILGIRAPYLKIYTEYISKFDKALKTLDEWTKKSPQFAEVVHDFEAQSRCASIPLAGYMLDIVQRITRYKMLMGDYVKHLPEDSNDREDSEKALEEISATATHVNETIRQMDNFRKVVEVRKKLIGDSGDTLITPYRKLLKEGELLKFSRKERQPRMFFLFNDILIYASSIAPANTTYRVIKRIPLEGMQVEPLDDPEMKYGFQIVSTCKSFRLEASNREEKTQWLIAFETAIKEQSERMKNRARVRQILAADGSGADVTDSVPLGHLAPPWLQDSAVSMCQLCSVTFTLTRRRHHCRACGMIYCSDCSSYYAPLKYMNNKSERVCQSCHGKICSEEVTRERSPQKRPSKTVRGGKVTLPSVLREIRARDQSAQVSGYLLSHTSKSKRWKRRWYVVYNLVLYEFRRHEDVSAKRSITLPSYQVISPVPSHDDPLMFVLKHDGAGKEYFKTEHEDQLERWVEVLGKAVRCEVDSTGSPSATDIASPVDSISPPSLDYSQEQELPNRDSSSS